MKKIFFGVILFFALIVFAEREARSEPNFVWSFGEIGIGAVDSEFDFNFKLFNLFLRHELSPFGLEIIPVTYNHSNFYDGRIVSFLNTKVYLSPGSRFADEHSRGAPFGGIISPFIGVRALNIPNFHSYNYIIDVGLKWALYFGHGAVLNFFNLEVGYEYFKQNREHTAFISLSTGLPLLLPLVPFF